MSFHYMRYQRRTRSCTLKSPKRRALRRTFPARRGNRMEVSTGEVLYAVLVLGVCWWAYNTLKQYM